MRIVNAFASLGLLLLLIFPAKYGNADSIGTSHDQSAQFVHPEELIEILKTQDVDKIMKTIDNIRNMFYKGQILPIIEDLWDQRKDKYPDLPWELVNSPTIKLELANILARAQKQGRIKVDKEAIHSFVLGYIESENSNFASRAITILSTFDAERDVEKILAIAKKQDKGTFEDSLWALNMMCNPKSKEALDELVEHVQSAEAKAYIVKRRNQMDEFTKESKRCEPTF